MSYRNVIISWRIVMHTMCCRDVLEHYWIVDVCSLSYRIGIVSWCIVVHTNTNKL